jgi:23S rRNA (adenine2503-C2)-methyltransferase
MDMTSPPPIRLLDLDLPALAEQVKSMGQPAFRAKQIYRQLWVNLAESAEEMSDLPAALRHRLSTETEMSGLRMLRVRSGDGGLTRKAVFALPGGETVEAVLMVYPGRATVCVSSQAGCPMGCTFCATARLGFLQDLSPGQIAGQVLWAQRELKRVPDSLDPPAAAKHRLRDPKEVPQRLTNVVFMGMGEPFNNYLNWRQSVELLHDPEGFNFGARNFTVSTVGLVPGILKLMEDPLQINLAVSLHAADDEIRSDMMPVNRRYPIAELLDAVRQYTARTRRRVSFEYVLIEGKNDDPGEAAKLADVLLNKGKFPLHVNLIPLNPVKNSGMTRSSRERVDSFQAILERRGIPATVRIQRGADLDAACGQLAGETARELSQTGGEAGGGG